MAGSLLPCTALADYTSANQSANQTDVKPVSQAPVVASAGSPADVSAPEKSNIKSNIKSDVKPDNIKFSDNPEAAVKVEPEAKPVNNAAKNSGVKSGDNSDDTSADKSDDTPDDLAASEFIHEADTEVVSQDDNAASKDAAANPSGQPAAQAAVQTPVTPADELDLSLLHSPVDRNRQMFTGALKSHFSQWLARSSRYIGMMKDIFRENYMPEDLVFLALIESGFNPKAYSWANASGPWQFIRGTGKKYGLKIDWWVDERRDPVKSTKAAAAYLKDLHGMFGSWPLAMASYNAGEGNVARAVNRNRTLDFWELTKTRSLPSETKDYVPKFIAARAIAQNPGQFGFGDLSYEPPFEFDEVVVDSPTNLNVVAQCTEVNVDVIKELNPELMRGCTPPNRPDGYTLRIPKGRKDEFMKNYANLDDKDKAGFIVYIARRNETISSIARTNHLSASTLAQINNMKAKTRLRAGQSITIPASEIIASSFADEPAHSRRHSARGTGYYKVRQGDTIAKVARRHGMSATRLARLNGIGRHSRLSAGQRIRVASARTSRRRLHARLTRPQTSDPG